MPNRLNLGILFLLAATLTQAQSTASFDAAAAFGARPGVSALSLSPDGQRITRNALMGLLPWSRLIAINADGTNVKLLSTVQNQYSRGWQLGGGDVIDWLPHEDGSVLMARWYIPDDHLGTRLGSSDSGLGIDRIDTRTLSSSHVERASPSAVGYLTHGRAAESRWSPLRAGDLE